MKYRGVIHLSWGVPALWDVDFMNEEYFTEGCRTCGWLEGGLRLIQSGDKLTIYKNDNSICFTHKAIRESAEILWSGIVTLTEPTEADQARLGGRDWKKIPVTPNLDIVMKAFACNAPALLERP